MKCIMSNYLMLLELLVVVSASSAATDKTLFGRILNDISATDNFSVRLKDIDRSVTESWDDGLLGDGISSPRKDHTVEPDLV